MKIRIRYIFAVTLVMFMILHIVPPTVQYVEHIRETYEFGLEMQNAVEIIKENNIALKMESKK